MDRKYMLAAETALVKKLITEIYPTGVVSLVGDSFHWWEMLTHIAPTLKEDILNRQPNALGLAKTVFRPDSGDPVKVICGYKTFYAGDNGDWDLDNLWNDGYRAIEFMGQYKEIITKQQFGEFCAVTRDDFLSEAEVKGAVQCLWDTFGGTTTETGHKVLHERVGLIYGDSITLERAEAILKGLEAKGFASCNIVFGIGSYTYQHVTRDSYGFAMKATYGEINGEGVEIFKDPITDSGTKKSAKGLLRVEEENGNFVLYDQQTWDQEKQGKLKTVFKDGIQYNIQTLSEIRSRLIG